MNNTKSQIIEAAKEKFGLLLLSQLERAEEIAGQGDFTDYQSLPKITIGVVDGDGIGPIITKEAARILEFILKNEIESGKIEIKHINGLTIENRLKAMKPIPDSVMEQIKSCCVLLKGPTETPNAVAGTPNIESANVALRKALDLFANVRPICVPEQGIDWTFFRENTEGSYVVGSQGISINDDLAVDFTIATTEGSKRVIKAAFEYARSNGKKRVSAVTKANIIKTTDGKFLKIFKETAKEYPEIIADDWYVDIMAAKLLDEKRRTDFQVIVMPNLYGDILTDEAAQLQGGVGTAGSANIGKKWAMFEAVHGSAPRMIEEKRGAYANPSSIIKAASMLLSHIGYSGYGETLDKALNLCGEEKKLVITGMANGATCREFGDYVMEKIKDFS